MARDPNRSNVSNATRKASQLCAQVEEIVGLALGESGDARLRELTMHSVVPGADSSRVLIRVVVPRGAGIDEIEAAYEALTHARSWLRQQVAAEIHRKRTPELDFQVLPAWEAET